MRFTLRQLQYFVALCEQRNFGRAAEACHVSQPALSVQIKSLEDQMGGCLVERRARDVVVTPLGRQVLSKGEAILRASRDLERLAQDQGSGRRSLSLGVIPTIAPYLLPGLLAQLRAGDLELRIDIREARTGRLLEDLQEGTLDAAIMALPSGAPGFVEEELFQDRFLLAGSSNRLRQMQSLVPELAPSSLRAESLMLLEDGHCLTDQALEVCGMQRGSSGINMGAGSLATLSRLVAAGFGLTLMPELALQAECSAVQGLSVARFAGNEPFRRIGLLRRRSTSGEGWFQELGEVVRETGADILHNARKEYGPAKSEPVS
ncbi:hydrogen peroxide-inducible genes activator [Roseobacter sp. SK209-2-6]|uniref:hydrogen peroxide-inducible genes activator n=1 Tax=Roseobacter sp. SK209-2-6 TaxID=388739 RepID=UPI000569C486|nr:hydrogen peroxide-inducible genes activator [Roseobacter sp. SK209-2-6]